MQQDSLNLRIILTELSDVHNIVVTRDVTVYDLIKKVCIEKNLDSPPKSYEVVANHSVLDVNQNLSFYIFDDASTIFLRKCDIGKKKENNGRSPYHRLADLDPDDKDLTNPALVSQIAIDLRESKLENKRLEVKLNELSESVYKERQLSSDRLIGTIVTIGAQIVMGVAINLLTNPTQQILGLSIFIVAAALNGLAIILNFKTQISQWFAKKNSSSK